tara:strand:+ start:44 stop:196 length:153 start_codon:yes stop_codon:yes gene_type:complete
MIEIPDYLRKNEGFDPDKIWELREIAIQLKNKIRLIKWAHDNRDHVTLNI